MRHRIISGTGLGNPDPEILDNTGKKPPQNMVDEAIELYFARYEGCDYKFSKNKLVLGVEPGYQYERLTLIEICRDKKESKLTRGKAWGGYGSQIAKNEYLYKDYKVNGKFKKFVDKWHPVLFK